MGFYMIIKDILHVGVGSFFTGILAVAVGYLLAK